MRKIHSVIALMVLLTSVCFAESVTLNDLPPLPKDTYLFTSEQQFGYRGKIGGFVLPPSRIGVYFDNKEYYHVAGADRQSMKIMYKKPDKKSFCGAYVIFLADVSAYKTLTFYVKGQSGQESFEIGMNDVVSNKREDAVYTGAINRYLPGGVTRDWQLVRIPLSDFYGPDISRVYSFIFHFNDASEGVVWIDEIRFLKEDIVSEGRGRDIEKRGYFLLDNFDNSDLNLLGRKTNAYKKLPSVCVFERTDKERFGALGRSLRITYRKESTGWCGYYSLLNQIDGEYYDLRPYKAVSFMVKGEKGGETFELGMADKNWVIIGDSLKAGSVGKYLTGGVTTDWKEVIIPLEDFGLLDLSEMGSFVINFYEKGEGAIYIDDLKFYLKEKETGHEKTKN
ncbi:MAG: hypothetical protein HY589_01325 [Candidatus Omnitrophica bacterium]|nr:hypothetical protein [Candidatus Omnitrophota bacterium]